MEKQSLMEIKRIQSIRQGNSVEGKSFGRWNVETQPSIKGKGNISCFSQEVNC